MTKPAWTLVRLVIDPKDKLPIVIPGRKRELDLLELVQWINDTNEVFNANGAGVKMSIRLQGFIDQAELRSSGVLEIPDDLHNALKSAIERGPLPVKPARRLQPILDEISEPKSMRANGTTETISSDKSAVSG